MGLEKPKDKKQQPKRIRGWQMEMETGRKAHKKSTLEKVDGLERPEENQSGLANKLLSLWSTGIFSATLIREIAHLAMQGGCDHPEVISLAKVGNWGAQTGNCHRQLLNQFCPQIMLPEAFQVKVKCQDPKTSLEKEDWASIFLPHLQFAHLGEHYPMFFQKAFCLGKGDLEKFWGGVEKVKDDRLKGHPMCLEKHWKTKVVPLFLHGDGVEYQNRDSLMVWSWGCLLADMPSMQQHMLLACYPKSCTTAQTWDPIWTWLKWSFEALGKGFHPKKDPYGKPLPAKLLGKAGQPLHPLSWKGHVFSIQGDHEFYSNTLKLPHWASHMPCWECDCQNWADCDPNKSMKQLDLEKSSWTTFSHSEHLADPWSQHAVLQLPHVSAKNIRGDPMHILFCKGVYGHVLGGILHYACWYEGPGKVCKERPWKRLGLIFDSVQSEYKQQGIKNRLTNLKLSMFTDAAKPWAGKASLDCKAAEAKHLLPALVPVLEQLFHGTKKKGRKENDLSSHQFGKVGGPLG